MTDERVGSAIGVVVECSLLESAVLGGRVAIGRLAHRPPSRELAGGEEPVERPEQDVVVAAFKERAVESAVNVRGGV